MDLKSELLSKDDLRVKCYLKKISYDKKFNLSNLILEEEDCFILENTQDNEYSRVIAVNPCFKISLSNNPSEELRKVESVINKMTDLAIDFPVMTPFIGGFVGMVYFEYSYLINQIKHASRSDYGFVHFYRDLIFYDKVNKYLYFISFYFPEVEFEGKKKSQKRISGLIERIDENSKQQSVDSSAFENIIFSKEKNLFSENILTIKKEIKNGNLFQCVLSEKREAYAAVNPLDIFEKISNQNKVPYCFYIKNENIAYMGASPEYLIKCTKSGEILTSPIAGTRAISTILEKNQKRADDLMMCSKESAEHLMLVDLSRNDLGKVCCPESIKVKDYKKLILFDHVMHLVSRVEGQLESSKGFTDAFEACFPAGTLSGAPKVESLKNIQKLESSTRRSYGGSLVLFDFFKNFESIIGIRNLEFDSGQVSYRVGAGIVYDSTVVGENKELENKAKTVERALGRLK